MEESEANAARGAIESGQAQTERLLDLTRGLAEELRSGRAVTVRLDTHLDRELGLGSLGRAELLARVERELGVRLPSELLASAETPADFVRALGGVPALPGPGSTAAQTAPAPAPAPALDGGHRADLGVPDEATTINEVLAWQVARQPAAPHLVLSDGQHEQAPITFAELARRATGVARSLIDAGIAPGDRVALMLPTGEPFFAAFFGILQAAAVPVPIYPPVRPSQLEDHLRRQVAILDNAGASLLITVDRARQFARLLRAHLPALRGVTTVERLQRDGEQDASGLPDAHAEQTALIQYTSGSTGAPKGVVLSHANLLANIRGISQALGLAGAGDSLVSWLPLYHDMGLIGAWFGALYQGAVAVIMSPLDFLARPASWLWTLQRCGGTFSVAPNFAYELCASRVADDALVGLDLSVVRLLLSGAEPIDPSTLRRFSERFARYGLDPAALTPVYGLAENAVGLTIPPPGRGPRFDRIQRAPLTTRGLARPAADDDQSALEIVTCGPVMPRHELRIVDETGREAPERTQGRVQFRGPSATGGYYRNPQANARLFDGDWLETGDLGYLARGELHLTGRIKDLIIRAGRNIYPHEIEQVVGEVAGVRKGCVAAFGSADPQGGTERLVVLAETREKDPARREAIEQAIGEATAALLDSPADVVVLAPPHAVPKTSSGKVRRQAARALFEAGRTSASGGGIAVQLIRMTSRAIGAHVARKLRGAVRLLWACWFWLLLLALLLPSWAVMALVPHPRACWAFAGGAARWFLRLVGIRLRVLDEHPGAAHAAGPSAGAVLVSNHASYLDGLVLVAALRRRARMVVKRDLGGGFFVRLLLRRLGALQVERFDREQGLADTRAALDALRAGERLLFFPEGTLTRRPGLLDFQLGAFHVAAEAGAALLPVVLRGTRNVLRDGQWIPRRGPLEVTVGRAIVAPRRASDGSFATAIALRDAARAAILAQCGEPDLAGEARQLGNP